MPLKRQKPLAAVLLAAGKGTRMKSTLPKVLHAVAGQSILGHMLGLLNAIGVNKTVVVVAPDQNEVAEEARRLGASSAVQEQQLGTGDAARAALPALEGFAGDVMVLYGDHPLFTPATLEKLLKARESGAEIAFIGFKPDDPAAYGRLVLLANGDVDRIVEYKDASEEQRRIKFCSAGSFTLDAQRLGTYLAGLDNNNAQREFYLTGIVDAARKRNLRCVAIEAPAEEVLGVNSRAELALVESVMQRRLRERAMENGATLIDPSTVWFSHDTQLGRDVTVGPNVFFGPKVRVADNVRINAFCHFEDCSIGEGAIVGPYARLRPGAQIGRDVHIGNFVEVKKAVIEDGAKANHLTYIGDARVGAGSNVGAGTITCNYDGFDKHFTDIGRNVFIGSNSALVAPVKINDGAYIGAGSVITKEVEGDALAVERSEQRTVGRWAAKFRERKRAEKAAKAKSKE
ncbi:MAG: bifunctional UDP-N-acetylglucosamine diphosphorylase/glucosamine-1-phosphate N-acetyltransferase GlmU [Alphaproteobacteria bacterium]|nr:bifunctional UDP-N-acetylglucosamine diphosphorylase/glucosamine-1-phosphate N-acetyltransferase GlmU [Alphaproteobacteria bacterium]